MIAYVEDTSARGLQFDPECEPDCTCCPYNVEPRMILEIADCERSICLEFDVDTAAGRANSQHKLDTLIAALRVFRAGVVAEFEPFDRRERELAELKEKGEPGDAAQAALPLAAWGRSSMGRAPRLHRGRAGSNPAVSTSVWGRSMRFGDCTRSGSW